jgi:hypothetical protein
MKRLCCCNRHILLLFEAIGCNLYTCGCSFSLTFDLLLFCRVLKGNWLSGTNWIQDESQLVSIPSFFLCVMVLGNKVKDTH